MNEKETKKLHLENGALALLNLETDPNITDETVREYRKSCIVEFITMIETGKTDHINVNEDGKRIEHFK